MRNVRRSTRPLHILPCARCLQLILLGMLVASSVALGADTRPNILLIYTDDQSHRSVSCYPEAWEWVRTPNIDRLASRGVRFAHAFIGTWCMPSRATLLTGHHPFGVRSMRMAGQYPGSPYDPAECPFWPKVFRSEGYTTAQVGKGIPAPIPEPAATGTGRRSGTGRDTRRTRDTTSMASPGTSRFAGGASNTSEHWSKTRSKNSTTSTPTPRS